MALLVAFGELLSALKGSNMPGTMKGSRTSHLCASGESESQGTAFTRKRFLDHRVESSGERRERHRTHPPMLTPMIKFFS